MGDFFNFWKISGEDVMHIELLEYGLVYTAHRAMGGMNSVYRKIRNRVRTTI